MTTSVLYLGCPAPERADMEQQLGAADLSVVWAEDAPSALSELERRDMPVLLDVSRGTTALQAAREIRAQRATTLMFAVVDARRPDLTTEAVLAGMADVFQRPLEGRRVVNAIKRELKYQSRENLPAWLAASDDLYGHSMSMREVTSLISRAAGIRAGVLICGEEGTGRQVAARAIHSVQLPSGGAFVPVDCAACAGEELEAQLFGPTCAGQNGDGSNGSKGLEHVSRHGRVHLARGGTLFLQNVAEAPTRVQARLAKVLRDREAIVTETGETTPFDIRPMAGVGAGFDIAVQDGRIRDDLFRRLSVMRIEMPPLRNRREDIPALANYFVRQICASVGVPPKTFSRPALALISALPLRGNARELQSLLENVVTTLAGGRGIGLDDVLAHVRLDGGGAVFTNGGTLRQARARFERDYITAVLQQHHGRISDAAEALGIQRTNLYRKMRSLRVVREPR